VLDVFGRAETYLDKEFAMSRFQLFAASLLCVAAVAFSFAPTSAHAGQPLGGFFPQNGGYGGGYGGGPFGPYAGGIGGPYGQGQGGCNGRNGNNGPYGGIYNGNGNGIRRPCGNGNGRQCGNGGGYGNGGGNGNGGVIYYLGANQLQKQLNRNVVKKVYR
jgi:hypothetical protein